MRFFIGAVVSSLILSPLSVLSMAVGAESTEVGAGVIDASTQSEIAELGYSSTSDSTSGSPSGSTLDKRFCIRRGCKEHKKHKRTSGFQCKKKYFSPEKIERARAAACPKIKENKQRSAFPSLYTASDFDIKGPYLEWPIRRNGRFYNSMSKSRYRIILTKDCKVVGAVIREKNSSYRTCKDLREDESAESAEASEDDE